MYMCWSLEDKDGALGVLDWSTNLNICIHQSSHLQIRWQKLEIIIDKKGW
jgi:hypothetical protein